MIKIRLQSPHAESSASPQTLDLLFQDDVGALTAKETERDEINHIALQLSVPATSISSV